MKNTPHELQDEFPDKTNLIHDLKMNDAHFAKLAEQYHEVNREIHRLETRVEAGSEAREEDLRRQRMRLKDEIASMLAKA